MSSGEHLGWENGKRRRKSLYGKTRADVAERLRQLQQQAAQGLPLPDERRRVADYLEWWATDMLPGTVKESTADGYRYMLDRYVVPQLDASRSRSSGRSTSSPCFAPWKSMA